MILKVTQGHPYWHSV